MQNDTLCINVTFNTWLIQTLKENCLYETLIIPKRKQNYSSDIFDGYLPLLC